MRSLIMAAALSLSTALVAAPALAGDKGDRDGAAYPMPAAAFKQKTDAREAKAREHLDKRAAKLPAEEARALRAKFDAGVAKVNAEVARATADGTVTKDEAQAVRKTAREVRGHHHGAHARKHAKK
jgi:hypothetical protein